MRIRLFTLFAICVLGIIVIILMMVPIFATEKHDIEFQKLRIGEYQNLGVRFIEPTTTNTLILSPSESVRVPLGTPGFGQPGLVIHFETLNEFHQPVASNVLVDNVVYGKNLINGQIHLPSEGENLVLEFQAPGYQPISYTLNYRVKYQRKQELIVRF